MRAWILAAALAMACGSEERPEGGGEERAAEPLPEPPPPPEMAEPPPVPMGWSANTDRGVSYAMPPDWARAARRSHEMVFSWQGPGTREEGRATFILSRTENAEVVPPSTVGETLARELVAQGATDVTTEIVRDWSGAEWARVRCTLRAAGAPSGAHMNTWVRVRPDGVSLRVGCAGPQAQAMTLDGTCAQLFGGLVFD